MAHRFVNPDDRIEPREGGSIPLDPAPFPGMVWVPGGMFMMGSDHHYAEEAPAHRVRVGGFWMDVFTVTNRDFERFVAETRYVTLAERPADPDDYAGAKPEMLVPSSIYQLLFHAERDEYAFLIVAPLFWVFGFWGVVGPALAAWRVRTLMKALEAAQSSDQIRAAFEQHQGRDVIVDLVASEYRLPKFIARRVCDRVIRELQKHGSLPV